MVETAHPGPDNQGFVPLSWFGQTLKRFRGHYIELIFIAICLRLLGLVEPFIFQVIIDRILPFQREASLITVAAIFCLATLFQIAFRTLSQMLGLVTANAVTSELGDRIYGHLLRLPFGKLRGWSVGELLARIGETDTIRSFIVGAFTGVLLDLVFVVIYLAVLASLSGTLTLIVLAAIPLQILVYLGFGWLLRKRLRAQFDARAKHQAEMVESISGAATIKALGLENKIVERLSRVLKRRLETTYQVAMPRMISARLIFAIEQTLTISVIFFGAQMVFQSEMTLGQLIAFHLLVRKVTAPIATFSRLWENWQNVRISRQRLGDVLLEPIEEFGTAPPLPRNPAPELSFDKVSFGYQDAVPVMTEFDFSAPHGSLVLVIGPSGTGKSTFGRLAAGLERATTGRIRIGDAELAQHDPASARRTVAYVPQETFLFSGTLRENLCIGLSEPVEEPALIAALEQAAASDLLTRLPKGLDTFVGERGSALSGGQRQRVAIARALLRHPPILILDEPTAALDPQSQSTVAQSLQRLRGKITVIVITHAPELFDVPDQIVDFGAFLDQER